MAMRYNDGFADYNQIHARAQAIADVQDDAAEEDRRRRVKEENLAAFDAAREEGRSGRSMVTASAFDGNGMRRDYMGGRLVGEMPLDDQARIGADFDDLAMRSAAIKRHNAQLERDTVSALMRQARKNGGMVPQNLVDQASANFGMDGKNRAVFRAGYLSNGDFGIDIAERGANGAMQRSTSRIPIADQYSIVNGTPGIWGDDGIAESANLYGQLRNTRGKSTLPADTYRQSLAAYRQDVSAREQQQANAQMDKLMFDIVRDSIKGSGGNGGGKNYRLNAAMKLLTDKNARSWLMQGLEQKDDDGNVVTNGEDEIGNPIPVIDQDKLMQRIDGVIDRYSQQNGSANNAPPEWVMKFLDQRFGPRQLSPEEAEIRQRQRQNALDDQRRADVMRGRDQQLIHYLDENGTHKVGNGYVVDGKVYDGHGNEMAGVQLADRNGNPLQTAQAQPSTQDGQDGGALLRQMRGGQPPAAQGGEQSGPGGAQRAVQSEDSPIPAPNDESETTHNGKRYRWGWNKQQGRWAYNPVEPTRDEALSAEKARRRRNGEQMRKQAGQAREGEPPKLDSPSTTNNSVPVSIGNSLSSRPSYDEEPMLPEERERREAERERREAELLEQNRRESVYRRFMDEHGRGPTEDELKAELARLSKIAG